MILMDMENKTSTTKTKEEEKYVYVPLVGYTYKGQQLYIKEKEKVNK